jgi:hypothetical protein
VDPLTTAVATAVTHYLVDGAAKLGVQIGAVAADAARTLANMVLDRLSDDPAEARNIARYRAQPVAMQPSIEAALADLVERDKDFARQLQTVLGDYDPNSPGAHVEVHGNVGGSIQVGDNNVQIDRSSGSITFNR